MAQLYFRYGTMASSKSANLIMTAHNYEETGRHVMILSSIIDTRSRVDEVSSRVGIKAPAIPIECDEDLLVLFDELRRSQEARYGYSGLPDCVLVDEAQFLTPDQVKQLGVVVDDMNIPVICYGLKTDFTGRLFAGAKALFEVADKIEEIKTVCRYCDRKATYNLRTLDGKPTATGEQIQIGDQEYIPVCRKHFNEALWSVEV